MPESRSNVFVSGTSNDLASYRRVVKDALLDCQLFPLVQEHFASDARSLEERINAMIGRADMVICLVGFEFGDAPASTPDRSWSQLEYASAERLGKPIYVFFSSADLRPPGSVRDAKRDLLQEEYRDTLKKHHHVRFFGSPDELRVEVAKLVISLGRNSGNTRLESLSGRDLSILGGTVGGLLAGLIIAAIYYFNADRSWTIAGEIVGYTTLVGSWAAFAIPWLKRKLSTSARGWIINRLGLNEVVSTSLAGICAAPVIGIFGVVLFAFNPVVMDIETVFPATALGAMFVSSGVLLSESTSSVSGRLRVILSSALVGVFVLLASTLLTFLKYPMAALFVGTPVTYVLGGAILSGVVGLEIGLQLGLARLVHKHLESKEAMRSA